MHVEVVVVVEGAVPVDAVEEVVPAVGGVVAFGVGVHGVEVLRHVIEVDDEGVKRDCGIISPQVLVNFGLVVVEPFLVADFFHQHMPIHNAGDWALGRAGEGAESLKRRIALRGGTELSGIGICHPRVATRRGRPFDDREGLQSVSGCSTNKFRGTHRCFDT
jgi:hypothetical protein